MDSFVVTSVWNSARICDTAREQLSIDFVHNTFFPHILFLG